MFANFYGINTPLIMLSAAKDLANGSQNSQIYKSVLLGWCLPTPLHHWQCEWKFSASSQGTYGMAVKAAIQFKKIINCEVIIAIMKVFTRNRDITMEEMINYLGSGNGETFLWKDTWSSATSRSVTFSVDISREGHLSRRSGVVRGTAVWLAMAWLLTHGATGGAVQTGEVAGHRITEDFWRSL